MFFSAEIIILENSEFELDKSTDGASNSIICPFFITIMRSHEITVFKRWAMVNIVVFENSFWIVFCTAISVSGSTAAVASSNTNI